MGGFISLAWNMDSVFYTTFQTLSSGVYWSTKKARRNFQRNSSMWGWYGSCACSVALTSILEHLLELAW